jgi:hypothetical protein
VRACTFCVITSEFVRVEEIFLFLNIVISTLLSNKVVNNAG